MSAKCAIVMVLSDVTGYRTTLLSFTVAKGYGLTELVSLIRLGLAGFCHPVRSYGGEATRGRGVFPERFLDSSDSLGMTRLPTTGHRFYACLCVSQYLSELCHPDADGGVSSRARLLRRHGRLPARTQCDSLRSLGMTERSGLVLGLA